MSDVVTVPGKKLKAMQVEIAQLEAENERLKNMIEVLKMVVMESPESLELAIAILEAHNDDALGGE